MNPRAFKFPNLATPLSVTKRGRTRLYTPRMSQNNDIQDSGNDTTISSRYVPRLVKPIMYYYSI